MQDHNRPHKFAQGHFYLFKTFYSKNKVSLLQTAKSGLVFPHRFIMFHLIIVSKQISLDIFLNN